MIYFIIMCLLICLDFFVRNKQYHWAFQWRSRRRRNQLGRACTERRFEKDGNGSETRPKVGDMRRHAEPSIFQLAPNHCGNTWLRITDSFQVIEGVVTVTRRAQLWCHWGCGGRSAALSGEWIWESNRGPTSTLLQIAITNDNIWFLRSILIMLVHSSRVVSKNPKRLWMQLESAWDLIESYWWVCYISDSAKHTCIFQCLKNTSF